MKTQSQRGFTITELLVVVAIIAVGAALAIPQIQSSVAEYNLMASTEMLLAELDSARMMAISRGASYQVSLTTESIQIVDPMDPENPPRLSKNLDAGVYLTSTPPDPITFNPRGFAQGGVLRVENRHGEARLIVVDQSGRAEVRMPDTQVGLGETPGIGIDLGMGGN